MSEKVLEEKIENYWEEKDSVNLTDNDLRSDVNKVLDLFVPPAEEQQGGAGRFSLTENDVNDYKEWLKLKHIIN